MYPTPMRILMLETKSVPNNLFDRTTSLSKQTYHESTTATEDND